MHYVGMTQKGKALLLREGLLFTGSLPASFARWRNMTTFIAGDLPRSTALIR